MNIVEFSVKHSLFVNLLSFFLLVAGGLCLINLNREAFPVISFDIVSVNTAYRGASAEDVEKLVTTPLERELKAVDDIDEISSASREGMSSIILEINPDSDDQDKVVSDIQKAVDRVVGLPEEVEERPIVTKITSKKIPVINIALSGDLDEFKIRAAVDLLKDKLEEIDGVASVERNGYRDEEFWVEPDLEKMRNNHISIQEISRSLRNRNVSIPGGKLKTDTQEFSIKILGEFTTKEEIENVIIRANDSGNWLKVKDVAFVRRTLEEENRKTRVFGKKAISLVVYKRSKADAINVVDSVNKILTEFRLQAFAGLKITTYDDLSYYIKRRLRVLSSNGVIGFAFVLIILFIFLRARAAFFTALGIPISMCTALIIMYFSGISINLMTMFGLIIVLGMVVDDGIIISENVFRYVESGMPPRQAAIKGTTEVIAPVMATVATTICAFLPLMCMSGIIGKFIRNIPLMVIIALCGSVLEAFVILPSHLADFIKPVYAKKTGAEKRRPVFNFIVNKYKNVLTLALKYRYLVAVVTIFVFFGALWMIKFKIPFVMFDSRGVEQFQICAEAEPGTPLKKMEQLIVPVENIVSGIPEKYLSMFETNIGLLSENRGAGDPNSKFAPHFAQITIYLTPLQQRDKGAKEIIEQLRSEIEKVIGFEKLYFKEFKQGPPVGKSVDVKIRGEDYKICREIAQKVKTYLETLPGVSDIADNYNLAAKQLRVIVDKQKAAKAGLTINSVAAGVRNAFEGALATKIKQTNAEEKIKVLVRLPLEQRNSKEIFAKLFIPNSLGNLVPLSKIARIETKQSLLSITHLDGKRYISVSAEVDNAQMTSTKVNALLAEKFKNISNQYPGYRLKFGGEQEENRKVLHSLIIASLFAGFLIFLILAVEFNSLIQPFVVMLTIPFALIGLVLTFLIHHEPLCFLALLGIVGLVGVVVNDSIVLVDFINKLRIQGVERRTSIVNAGTLRFRPVLLTTLTTVAGLSTVAYGIGGFDPFLRPMALAIGWGLFFSTWITLLVMPCFYAIIDDLTVIIFSHPTVKAISRKVVNQ
ncbi:MAG: AcrB/AcrD/AcrF family protein [Candidatus Omnitrophota bacterium]|nr:MAG: AcrB/AcrD/AcrF family protein [Candidatus Omnitrophota bacterium]